MLKKIALLFILSAISSCNFHIEKRKYFKGYHIEIAKSQQSLPQKNDTVFSKKKGYNPSEKLNSKPLESFSKGIYNHSRTDDSFKENRSKDSKKDSHSTIENNEKQINHSIIITSSSTKKPQSRIKKIEKRKIGMIFIYWDYLQLPALL